MKQHDFTTTILVKCTPEEAYKSILQVRAWWSGLYGESFEGSSNHLGDEFTFCAGGGLHQSRQKLVELVPSKKVVWLVTEANLGLVGKRDEWNGTKLAFEISQELEETKIVFTHIGLIPAFECYGACAPAWMKYIHERLAHLLQPKALAEKFKIL